MLQLVESKESRYLEQLAVTFDQYGLSFDPKVLYSPPAPGDDAAAAAVQQLLQSKDIVAWVPKKKMMVSWALFFLDWPAAYNMDTVETKQVPNEQ
jgi:hypothetical protein